MYLTTHGILVVTRGDDAATLVTSLQQISITTEAALQDVYDLLEGAWTAYTPEWHASIDEPTIGNGSVQGRYFKVGRTVDVVASVIFGSTTTGGTGYYSISLPFAPRTGAPEQRLQVDVRGVHIADPAPRWMGDVRLYSQSPDATIHYDDDGTNDGRLVRLTATEPIPGGFGEGDVITVWGRYEALA